MSVPKRREPFVARLLIRLAGRLVPERQRLHWRSRQESRLQSWWALVERGDLIPTGRAPVMSYSREALQEAVWLRFNRQALRAFWRGPLGLLAGLGAGALVVGFLSQGFAGTRATLSLLRSCAAAMTIDRSDALVGHIFSLGFGLAIGAGAIAFQRLPFRGRHWRFGAFFLLKTTLALASVTLLWVEVSTALTASLPIKNFGTALMYLAIWAATMAAFGFVSHWSLTDQRRRCPVCLGRLTLPVAVGSWSSVLEPAATEMLCESGHGSLALAEAEMTAEDHWTTLDSSWRELFETSHR